VPTLSRSRVCHSDIPEFVPRNNAIGLCDCIGSLPIRAEPDVSKAFALTISMLGQVNVLRASELLEVRSQLLRGDERCNASDKHPRVLSGLLDNLVML